MIAFHSCSVGAGTGHESDPHMISMCLNSVARSEVLISRSGNPSNSGDASIGDSTIPSLHPVVGASDGRGHPVPAQEKKTGRGGNLLRSVARAARALDDHWIGDLIGAASLFGSAWLLMLIGYGMGWQ